MALAVAHLYAMKPFASDLAHVRGHGVSAIASQTVSTSTKDEMSAHILRLAEQLVDIAFLVANVPALLRLLEHRAGLAHIVEPADAFFLFNGYTCGID